MSASDLRAAVIAWLRSFVGSVDSDTFENLLSEMQSEFAVDTSIFVPREAFCDVLRDLHQMPHQRWDRDRQTWRPRPTLDWYASNDSAVSS